MKEAQTKVNARAESTHSTTWYVALGEHHSENCWSITSTTARRKQYDLYCAKQKDKQI